MTLFYSLNILQKIRMVVVYLFNVVLDQVRSKRLHFFQFIKNKKRDDKLLHAASLPKVVSYNMRSLVPKIDSFASDFEDRMCDLAFLSEIWENQ